MKKILILSAWGGGLPLALKMKSQGEQVRMWIKPHDGERTDVASGFVDKVNDFRSQSGWCDLVVVDDGGLGKESEEVKKWGKPVWGGDVWSDSIELDRGKGQDAFSKIGMKTIPSFEFTNIDEAINHVKKNPKLWVIKTDGQTQDEKSLSYVGKEDNGSDAVSMLEHYKAKWSAKIKKIQVQEFVKGIEVGVAGFFNGVDFANPIEVSFEHKPLMNDGIGPGTGEMGTCLSWMRKTKIYRETLGKAVKILSEHKYIGYVTIGLLATDKWLAPAEWTLRMGYPTLALQLETIKGNISDWMTRVAKGQNPDFTTSNPYSVCVVVATPPWPFISEEIYEKYSQDQIVHFRTQDRMGVWPGEIKLDGKDWTLAGGGGYSVVVTGQGKSVEEARKMTYKRLENFSIPNEMYRSDIAAKSEEDLKTLAKWNWFS